MKRVIISLLLTILLSSQAMAVQAQGTTPQSIVHAIMFWMDARIVKISLKTSCLLRGTSTAHTERQIEKLPQNP